MCRKLFILLIIITSACSKNPKEFAPAQSALVIEYSNGKSKILYQYNANEIRYPASLTKMMTIYLLLDAVQKNKLKMTTKFKVSKLASMQMPSKLNLKQGETISVADCIKALLVKSANDVAIVAAEGLEGSVTNFCYKMNQTAKLLGMTSTHFENPSGVPNKKQVTSASDIAKLGTKIYKTFPKYWHLFSLKNYSYNQKKYSTHCKILQWYKGADGAKTGFICASGYNLWVTAKRFNKDGKVKRLMAVVFGGRSGKQRDFYAGKLLEKYFKDYTLISDSKEIKSKLENISKKYDNNELKVNNKKVINKAINKEIIKQTNVIYEEDSISIDEILKSSGKTKQFFDELYKDDVEYIKAEHETEIDFSKQTNISKPIAKKKPKLAKNSYKQKYIRNNKKYIQAKVR